MAGAFVDEFGQVKEVFTRGCPIAFRNTALDTMRRWRFNVPTLAGRAATGRYEVELIFVGASVLGLGAGDEELGGALAAGGEEREKTDHGGPSGW